MANWLKSFQSLGRGIRNGELTVAMSGTGKSLIVDMESQGIEPTFAKFEPGLFRSWSQQHWCHDPETDKWTYHRGRPFHEYVADSDRILTRKDDGTYYWYKNRGGETMAALTDEELKELTFMFLSAEEVTREFNWASVRGVSGPIGAPGVTGVNGFNPCNEILLK